MENPKKQHFICRAASLHQAGGVGLSRSTRLWSATSPNSDAASLMYGRYLPTNTLFPITTPVDPRSRKIRDRPSDQRNRLFVIVTSRDSRTISPSFRLLLQMLFRNTVMETVAG